MTNVTIKIEQIVHAKLEKVWEFWTSPEHIVKWNAASDDWHTVKASNDLRIGGKLQARMEAKDGSMGFDFVGIYKDITTLKKLVFTLDDGRIVTVLFEDGKEGVKITEEFEAENDNSMEMQRQGWQAILDNFKKYVENS